MPALELTNPLDKISRRKIRTIINDPVKSAEAVNLIYVSDQVEGIRRKQKGSGFTYYLQGKKVTDAETLARIKSLVIPPAWKDVWICTLANGHLQVTGYDARNRKQYRYHPLWSILRNHTKFYRLYHFGTILPNLRSKLKKDISYPGLPVQKVLATVVSLMQRTNIRIGNCFYEKENGSYGITTLKDKHVTINGTNITFSFKGKKGVYHDIQIKNKRLAAIVKNCQDIPGKELFQYIDESGKRQCIDSGMVNCYIKEATGGDFTAKDLRTWSGTVQALLAFKNLGTCETQTQLKKNIAAALDLVSSALGNTRTVCRKYYVHPLIVNLYENKGLDKYLNDIEVTDTSGDEAGLTCEEKVLMQILQPD